MALAILFGTFALLLVVGVSVAVSLLAASLLTLLYLGLPADVLVIETAAGTDPNNGGTQPPLPLILKVRKVGPNIAGFFSTDGGKTQRFIGNLAPQFDPAASLLLGLATASGSDGTVDQAIYQNFVFAPLQ